jgi:hypothetical protein
MNRREAIAALTALPAVTRISRADLTPTDVIVIECDGFVSADQAERMTHTLREIWPNQRVVVLECGVRMKVVESR